MSGLGVYCLKLGKFGFLLRSFNALGSLNIVVCSWLVGLFQINRRLSLMLNLLVFMCEKSVLTSISTLAEGY